MIYMGTNFYTRENECEKCGRYDELHLGKSSGGWQFSFQYNGGRFYKNVPEMKKWLKGKTIKDEYGREVTQEEFWSMVEEKQKPEYENHAAMMRKEYPSHRDTEHVIDGYSFSDTEFS